MSPSQFEALAADWQSATDAIATADGNAARALELFRRTGDRDELHAALQARQRAVDQQRNLMQRVWARFGLGPGLRDRGHKLAAASKTAP